MYVYMCWSRQLGHVAARRPQTGVPRIWGTVCVCFNKNNNQHMFVTLFVFLYTRTCTIQQKNTACMGRAWTRCAGPAADPSGLALASTGRETEHNNE